MLAVVETHPIQYHAPVYRALQQRCGVPVTAIYGSDFSVSGYRDDEFQAEFAWDTDLLSGYDSVFLSRAAEGGARTAAGVSPVGIRQALKALRPAAVLLVGYSPRFHRTAWLDAWRGGYPILFRGETNDDARARGALYGHLRRAALRVAYRRCARLLYIGRRSYDHYRRLGVPDDRLILSPYCVDTSPFEMDERSRERLRPEGRTAIGVLDDRRVILYSGKLSHRKGVDLLLRAVRLLGSPDGSRIVVALVGDGDQRAALLALSGATPGVSVTFTGFQNQRRLSRYYHAADLLCLPSRHSETWGLVVNEALHHGVPCVVSDAVGCAPDLIESGSTGVVFRSGSAESLAAALEPALGLCGRPEIRDACRKKVAGYTIDRAADGIARAYEAIAAGGARSRVPAA